MHGHSAKTAILHQYAAWLLSEWNEDECDTVELLHSCYTEITFSEAVLYTQRVY